MSYGAGMGHTGSPAQYAHVQGMSAGDVVHGTMPGGMYPPTFAGASGNGSGWQEQSAAARGGGGAGQMHHSHHSVRVMPPHVAQAAQGHPPPPQAPHPTAQGGVGFCFGSQCAANPGAAGSVAAAPASGGAHATHRAVRLQDAAGKEVSMADLRGGQEDDESELDVYFYGAAAGSQPVCYRSGYACPAGGMRMGAGREGAFVADMWGGMGMMRGNPRGMAPGYPQPMGAEPAAAQQPTAGRMGYGFPIYESYGNPNPAQNYKAAQAYDSHAMAMQQQRMQQMQQMAYQQREQWDSWAQHDGRQELSLQHSRHGYPPPPSTPPPPAAAPPAGHLDEAAASFGRGAALSGSLGSVALFAPESSLPGSNLLSAGPLATGPATAPPPRAEPPPKQLDMTESLRALGLEPRPYRAPIKAAPPPPPPPPPDPLHAPAQLPPLNSTGLPMLPGAVLLPGTQMPGVQLSWAPATTRAAPAPPPEWGAFAGGGGALPAAAQAESTCFNRVDAGYAAHATGYAASASIYCTAASQGFAPSGQGFAPNGRGFAPNGQGFAPNYSAPLDFSDRAASAVHDGSACSDGGVIAACICSEPAMPRQGKDKLWSAMVASDRSAAAVLGWRQPTWDAGERTTACSVSWAALGAAERRAAAELGYDEEEWDAELHADFGGGGTVAAPAVVADAATLGAMREAHATMTNWLKAHPPKGQPREPTPPREQQSREQPREQQTKAQLPREQQPREQQLRQQPREQQTKAQPAQAQQPREQPQEQQTKAQPPREQQAREQQAREQPREQQTKAQLPREQQPSEQQLRQHPKAQPPKAQPAQAQQAREQQLREQPREQQTKAQPPREQQPREQQPRQHPKTQPPKAQPPKAQQPRDQPSVQQTKAQPALEQQPREQQLREQQSKAQPPREQQPRQHPKAQPPKAQPALEQQAREQPGEQPSVQQSKAQLPREQQPRQHPKTQPSKTQPAQVQAHVAPVRAEAPSPASLRSVAPPPPKTEARPAGQPAKGRGAAAAPAPMGAPARPGAAEAGSAQARPGGRVLLLRKPNAASAVGLTLRSDGRAPPFVSALAPSGLASAAGLRIGDSLLSVNGSRPADHESAIAMIRTAEGVVELRVAATERDATGEEGAAVAAVAPAPVAAPVASAKAKRVPAVPAAPSAPPPPAPPLPPMRRTLVVTLEKASASTAVGIRLVGREAEPPLLAQLTPGAASVAAAMGVLGLRVGQRLLSVDGAPVRSAVEGTRLLAAAVGRVELVVGEEEEEARAERKGGGAGRGAAARPPPKSGAPAPLAVASAAPPAPKKKAKHKPGGLEAAGKAGKETPGKAERHQAGAVVPPKAAAPPEPKAAAKPTAAASKALPAALGPPLLHEMFDARPPQPTPSPAAAAKKARGRGGGRGSARG